MAHELGHVYDRDHVAVKDDPRNDRNYPNYGGHPRSIGEVGVDLGTSPPTLFNPAKSDDIMAYDEVFPDERWISPYTYRAILDNRASQQSAPVFEHVRPLGLLLLRLHRGGKIKLRKAFRVEASGMVEAPPAGAPSPVSIDLLDRHGAILATHHCRYTRPSSCGGCGGAAVPWEREPYIDLDEVVEWPDGTASVAVHRGAETIATLPVGEPPVVSVNEPDRRGDEITLRFTAEHPRERPTVAVLFSGDNGQTWLPVAIDPGHGQVTMPIERLPGGPLCRFRILATAELSPASADTEPFELPIPPRRLHLLLPDQHRPIPAGPTALRAVVDHRHHQRWDEEQVRWRSSLEGDLDTGMEIVVPLRTGEHEITVTAPDGLGGELTERGIILVGEPGVSP